MNTTDKDVSARSYDKKEAMKRQKLSSTTICKKCFYQIKRIHNVDLVS